MNAPAKRNMAALATSASLHRSNPWILLVRLPLQAANISRISAWICRISYPLTFIRYGIMIVLSKNIWTSSIVGFRKRPVKESLSSSRKLALAVSMAIATLISTNGQKIIRLTHFLSKSKASSLKKAAAASSSGNSATSVYRANGSPHAPARKTIKVS